MKGKRLFTSAAESISKIVHKVNVSELAKPFTDRVKENIYNLTREVEAGRMHWKDALYVSDNMAVSLGTNLGKEISQSKSPQKQELEEAVQGYNNFMFPELLLEGIDTGAPIRLPYELPAQLKDPQFHIISNVFTGFLYGPLLHKYTNSAECKRICPLSPKYFCKTSDFDTADLPWHTDDALSAEKSDTAIIVHQNNEGLSTDYLSAKLLYQSRFLEDRDRKILTTANFRFKENMDNLGFEDFSCIPERSFPIFQIVNNRVYIQHSLIKSQLGFIEGETEEAKEALRNLKSAIEKEEPNVTKLVLKPGNILLFRNAIEEGVSQKWDQEKLSEGNGLHRRSKVPYTSIMDFGNPDRRYAQRANIIHRDSAISR